MKLFKVPAVSVAVIDDYKIAWAKGYGVTEASGAMPVTTRTLFQAGSISKPVAAAAALYLVKNGKLSLDEDVNQKLKSWKVPEKRTYQAAESDLAAAHDPYRWGKRA